MIARLVAFALLLAAPAGAQTWTFVADPSDQSAMAILIDRRQPVISLHCLRPGFDPARFRQASGTDNLPRSHAPGNAVVTFYAGAEREGAKREDARRARLILRVDRQRFALRGARRDPATGQVFAETPLDGPEVAALRRGNRLRIILRDRDLRVNASLRGSDKALASLQEYCMRPVTPAGPVTTEALPDLQKPPAIAKTEPGDAAPATPPAATPPAATPPEAAPAAPAPGGDPVELALQRDFGDGIDSAYWFENPDPARPEALAFVYAPAEGGNAMTLTVALYRMQGGTWLRAGLIGGIFGADPRDAEFRPDGILVTTTTPKEGDPRCCPSGETRWLIDPAALTARPAPAQ